MELSKLISNLSERLIEMGMRIFDPSSSIMAQARGEKPQTEEEKKIADKLIKKYV